MRRANWIRCAAALVAISAAACIDRTRLNATCEWTDDRAGALDPARPADHRHLVADAQLAEGLAVRFADTEHRRRSGYGGHGRLLDHGEVLHACMDRMVAAIERQHGVTAAQIDAARGERSWWFDGPVIGVYAVWYVLGAALLSRWLQRRFADGSRPVRAAVGAATSIATSIVGIQLGVVWSAIWETVRIGDDHFGSFRATRPPWDGHLTAVFVGGVIVYWIVAAVVARAVPAQDAGHAGPWRPIDSLEPRS